MPNIISEHHIKQDNLLPILEFQFIDPTTGLPIPLTGGTARFRMKGVSGLKIDRAAVIDDADNGKGHYTWQSGDTDTPGIWPAEIEVTMPGSKPFTGPNSMNLSIHIFPKVA